MQQYRRKRRESVLNAFAREAKWRSNETTLTALSSAMIRKFGGMDNFVQEWFAQIRGMQGTKAALDGYQAIIRLLEVAEKRQRIP